MARNKDLAADRHLREQSPESINWLSLGTHPDLVDHLWRELPKALPVPCQWVVYGAPALVRPDNGVIFGWAGGTHNYTFRLSGQAREAALKSGALLVRRFGTKENPYEVNLTAVGEDWVFGNWAAGEQSWCLTAYESCGKSK